MRIVQTTEQTQTMQIQHLKQLFINPIQNIMRKTFFFAAAGLLALASCTTSDEVFNPEQDLTQQELNDNTIQFGTYLGKTPITRAGQTGNIGNTELKGLGGTEFNGFGVFAYYTPADGSSKYTYHNSATGQADPTALSTNYAAASKANFMFNQQVKWTSSNDRTGYIGAEGDNMWSYSPLKYWPNDFINNTTSGVDDQDNDADDNPANGSGNKGNVSFFAYAPYVDFSTTAANNIGINHTGTPAGTGYGIVAINDQTALATANDVAGDPILTYVINPSHSVDLLWGTANNTSVNVNEVAQAGSWTYYTPAGAGSAKTSKYPVNINLTKQKTNGTVNFAFKHALSRVGGSTIEPGNNTDNPNGLMVIVDIDDQKGAEIGGHRGTTTGIDNNTKVTIKSISISYDKIGVDEDEDGIKDGTEYYVTGGKLNLATGQWILTKDGTGTTTTHVIKENAASPKDAKLNPAIAEPATAVTKSNQAAFFAKSGDFTAVDGVPDNKRVNVYGDETNPFLFIPGTLPILNVTVDYLVRTQDANLSEGFSEVENIITKKITFNKPVEMNKQYSLLIHLGLTSVKFTAEVSNWTLDGDTNNNGVIDATEEVSIEDVFVPRNVSRLMASLDKVKIASTDATAPVLSEAKYFVDNIPTVVTSSASLAVTDVTPSGWVAASGSPATLTTFSANTSFVDRTATVTASITSPAAMTSEPIKITQYGRVATAATITWTSAAPGNIAKAADSYVTYSMNKVEATGFESDNTGAATSTAVAATEVPATDYTIVFIDDATGKKATWLTNVSAESKFKATSANTTGANRVATIYFQINGKLVPTTQKITQLGS